MTANKESLYWRSDKTWYRINEKGQFELAEHAPERAKESFKLYMSTK